MRHGRHSHFRSDDGGQAIIIVGLVMVVLLAAVALGLDWGYGLTQRRVMQNASDGGALAAAKLLAGGVVSTTSGNPPVVTTSFVVTGNAVYCEAWRVANANRGTFQPDPASSANGLTVKWSSNLSALDPWSGVVGGTFTPVANPGANCTAPVTSGTPVPSPARYIGVDTSVTYRGLVGAAAAGPSTLTASAHAVAALRGAPLPENGPSWPIIRHYSRSIFDTSCGTPCNPTTAQPVDFWASSANDVDYGTFQGMIDLSRYSIHVANGQPSCYGTPLPATCVPQLITHWDDSGPPSSPLPNLAGDISRGGSSQVNCIPNNAQWVTWGDDVQSGNVAGDDSQCSIPNWASKPFGNDPTNSNTGQLRIDTARGPSVDLGSVRSVCSAANKPPTPLLSPSCADPTLGDWVETNGGNTANKLSNSLGQFIAANGQTDEYSGVVCQQCPNRPVYGKYVVLEVYLWDCAQSYSGNNTWSLLEPKHGPADCSDIHKNADISPDNVDRVHLFTIAPFRFYAGLVNSSSISGFWGGLVSGDAGCPTCVINQFSNAVLLVGD
jgi:Flp pilus assembly protein TadG